MSATKVAFKRKISDELSPDESDGTSKKRKVEQRQNLNQETAKEPEPPVIFNSEENVNIRKIRKKLSSILHLKKRYKYYCKKHNVLYLIENTRKKSRELSRKSRDVLVHSFRSLDITKDFSVGKKLLDNSQQLLLQTEDEYNDDERNLSNQSTSDSVITKRKVSRIFVTTDENEMNNFAQCHNNVPVNKQTANRLTLNQIVHQFILSDESGDSDLDEGYTEEYYENSKNEDYILTRSPGGNNIIMKKVKDSNYRKAYEDGRTYCNCLHNYHNKNNLSDYDSTFEDDSYDGLFSG